MKGKKCYGTSVFIRQQNSSYFMTGSLEIFFSNKDETPFLTIILLRINWIFQGVVLVMTVSRKNTTWIRCIEHSWSHKSHVVTHIDICEDIKHFTTLTLN